MPLSDAVCTRVFVDCLDWAKKAGIDPGDAFLLCQQVFDLCRTVKRPRLPLEPEGIEELLAWSEFNPLEYLRSLWGSEYFTPPLGSDPSQGNVPGSPAGSGGGGAGDYIDPSVGGGVRPRRWPGPIHWTVDVGIGEWDTPAQFVGF